MTAFAVHVWRLFHGFTLRATVLLSIVNGAAAIWMRALFVIRHLIALFRFGEPLRQNAVKLGRRPNRKTIICVQDLAGYPEIRGNAERTDLTRKFTEVFRSDYSVLRIEGEQRRLLTSLGSLQSAPPQS
jgi:hypothetical protein